MQPQTLKLFAEFCESFLPEASTSMGLIQKHAGGQAVIQKLHKEYRLAHNQDYRPVEKIQWSELKDSYRGAWVIIQGTNGTGAIKASGGNTGDYTAVASTGGETRVVTDSRGGNIIDFLKGEIGKLQKFYVGKNDTVVKDKQQNRADAKVGTDTTISKEKLIKKFKPLWAKAITAAIADIKGHVANQIKNDAFEKAKRKLDHIEQLQNGLEAIEAGSGEVPQFIESAVNTAILMAAAHYYPEQTGDITKSYGRSYSSANTEGPQLLLKDIAEGDTSKLGTILSFFKRTLISG
jgi:hypothetical protein